MQVKDGVSWTALEYTKWLQTPDGIASGGQNVTIVPASIVYTDKSKYRSSVVIECVPRNLCIFTLITHARLL